MAAHVLLVEDSVLVTDALRILLEAVGHRVSVAADVEGAVVQCRTDQPDLMLLDLSLGQRDGLEVLAELRGEGHAPPMVAAMTGHDEPETRARCLAAGCRTVLVKPVPARELVRLVGEWTSEAPTSAREGPGE